MPGGLLAAAQAMRRRQMLGDAACGAQSEFLEEMLHQAEQMSSVRGLRGEVGSPDRIARLMVISCVLRRDTSEVSQGFASPVSGLSWKDAIDGVVNALRDHGLVQTGATMAALPFPLCRSDLETADVAGLLTRMLAHAESPRASEADRKWRAHELSILRAKGFSAQEPDAALHVQPCFFVLAYVGGVGETPLRVPQGDALAQEQFKQGYRDWFQESARLVRQATQGAMSCDLIWPKSYFEGVRECLETCRDLELQYAAIRHGGWTEDEVPEVCANVEVRQSPLSKERRVRVSFTRKSTRELVEEVVYPLFDWETPAVAADWAETTLTDMGFVWPQLRVAELDGPTDSIQGG
jgi:hypothetical protein